MEGKWRLQEGKVIITTVDFSIPARTNSIFTLTNSKFELTETGAGLKPDLYKGNFILSFDCSKDGHFVLNELLGFKSLTCEGDWNFNQRSGNKKSKEYLQMTITNTTSGKTSGYFLFNQSSVNFNYHIKELRDKKMVLEVRSEIYTNSQGLEQNYDGVYTFIQD